VHYDASREVRAKGAGFYQFSGDEETRRAQMEELKMARDETGKVRQELGAVDVRPGEVEGMQSVGGSGAGSRAMEKRKRELEERRKLLDAKRRKVVTDTPGNGEDGPPTSPSTTKPVTFVSHSPDPFAALEATSIALPHSKGKAKAPASEADFFLAQLEKDFLASKGR